MGFINFPYRVVYEAKGFRTGLTNVVAAVLKPNNVMAGPYPMTEMAMPFQGRYYFDFLSDSSDPEGEYMVMIVSPSDGIQTTWRMPLYMPPVPPEVLATGQPLEGFVNSPSIIVGEVVQSIETQGQVNEATIDGEIETPGEIHGHILQEDLEGSL